MCERASAHTSASMGSRPISLFTISGISVSEDWLILNLGSLQGGGQ